MSTENPEVETLKFLMNYLKLKDRFESSYFESVEERAKIKMFEDDRLWVACQLGLPDDTQIPDMMRIIERRIEVATAASEYGI